MDSKEMAPGDIERRSFEIIASELGDRTFPPLEDPIVKRVIHTTADFSYADSLTFSHNAAERALEALRAGACVLTDTNMALAGVSKPALAKLSCKAVCYMADPDVAAAAKAAGTTRAVASMDKACGIEGPLVIAVGNAPTALLRAHGRGQDRARRRHRRAGRVCERGRGERGAAFPRRALDRGARPQGRIYCGCGHRERAVVPDHAPGRP